MKKIFVMAAMLVATASTYAQVTYGPKLGLNLSNQSWKQGDYGKEWGSSDPENKMGIGWQLGFVANAQISENFAIRPGLVFNRLATKNEYDFGGTTVKTNTGATYLQIPVDFAYCIPVGDNQFQIFAGPYVQFGLSGKSTSDVEGSEDTKIKFKKYPDDGGEANTSYLNGLDAGFNFGVGFKVSSLLLSAQYGLGLSNISPKLETEPDGYERSKEDKYKWSNITIGVAYLFGGE